MTMEALKTLIEKEIAGIKKSILGKPEATSPYGKAYWTGNTDALKWVLKKIEDST